MMFLTLWLAGKLRVYSDTETISVGYSMIPLVPFAVSIFTAVSRTQDYHHNFSGILQIRSYGVIADSCKTFWLERSLVLELLSTLIICIILRCGTHSVIFQNCTHRWYRRRLKQNL